MRHLLLGAAAALLLLGALAVRRPKPSAERVRLAPSPAGEEPIAEEPTRAEDPSAPEAEETARTPGAEALFQNLGALAVSSAVREDGVRVTAEFLGLEGVAKEAFERAVGEVLADWAALQHSMGEAFALFPPDLPDKELERTQREAEERFQPQRAAILSRLEGFIADPGFRARLPEWVETVYAALRE